MPCRVSRRPCPRADCDSPPPPPTAAAFVVARDAAFDPAARLALRLGAPLLVFDPSFLSPPLSLPGGGHEASVATAGVVGAVIDDAAPVPTVLLHQCRYHGVLRLRRLCPPRLPVCDTRLLSSS